MKTIETIGAVQDDNCLILKLSGDILPGRYRIVLVLEEEPIEEELTEEEKSYFDRELKAIKENPELGQSWADIVNELEIEIGRKIPVHR
ncbi:MAG TPA: hypothetical protein PK453_23105 [Leptospiraceae bacterium]|nr:hypothetical protein [Leptospiraceae bacterium]HMY69982.1 hypothetical protein [Leptospiraceae bacterium]HNF16563.1 hypothetical protein [Leptospiraceae bacterium]HNI28393.1 hypothetical protein [Leptospiraceae bacterium]HNI97012.1 hypothetical protein [Leptospiraceae bacterium]